MSAAPQVKAGLKFEVEVVKGPHIGFRNTYDKLTLTIGRGPENDIVLSNDARVSRQHAEIKQRGTEFVIVNLSQKNFVMVNGQAIQSEIITNESVIQIGESEIRLKIEAPALPKAPPPVRTMPPPPVASASVPPSIPSMQVPTEQRHPAQGLPVQPVSYGGAFQAPPQPMGNPAQMGVPPQAVSSSGGPLQNPRVRFYGIIAIIGLVGWFIFSPSGDKNKKDRNEIRTSTLSMQDVVEAEKRSQELLTVKKERYDSIQYRRAQENFIKGFRDFQQGQYARAREAFQVVLNLDPDNELAKRYFHLSKIKFDELVKFNMIQGNRYREKRNWRMCQSNYSNVMTMLQYRKDDPSYREAKQFYDECTLNLEGRF